MPDVAASHANTRAAPARYRLSFTAGGLMLRESDIAIGLYRTLHDWAAVRQRINEQNLLQARTQSSAKRTGRELVQRLAELTDAELSLFEDAVTTERCHLLWAALCRRYALIAEFAEEVLRQRFLLLTPSITTDHFEAFLTEKQIWHDEIADLRPSSKRKLQTVLFRIMREAGLLTDAGEIVPALLSDRVAEQLNGHIPSDVRLFSTRDEPRDATQGAA